MFVLTDAVIRGINRSRRGTSPRRSSGPTTGASRRSSTRTRGRIPISQATIESDNTVYARLTLDLGPQSIADLATSMGIQSKLKAVPSIVLGVNAVSPLDLATAYATLADGGVAHRADDPREGRLPRRPHRDASQPKGKRIVDAKVAAAVTKVLEANVQSGTGTAAALSGRPVAGKTGTTDSLADAWFAGWVPQLTTVTWVGYPTREKPMGACTASPGSRAARSRPRSGTRS